MIAVLDTNIVAAGGSVPPGYDGYAISSATVAELKIGVACAATVSQRIARVNNLVAVMAEFGGGIPFDDAVGEHYARLVGLIQAEGGRHRQRVFDLIIAATAMTLGGVVVSNDARGFTLVRDRLVTVVEHRPDANPDSRA